ncbi:tetratricopeptide repeat protein [Pseudomonas donghuensis]|uniref:tetratricopeptide repeat protein n=1 Tax=Pseudomonas donghuensis TaxID=1163398 RepID=UPI002E108DB7|nr:tetratricopeptide repeat protein [Pseudomonas donghuensis]
MFKTLSLLVLVAAIAGCQSSTRSTDFDALAVGVGCVANTKEKPLERDKLRYIKRHANDGNAICKVILGRFYQQGGYGVDQDLRKARALFVEAATLNPANNKLLGQMAERGEGEPVDYTKAREFYRLSGNNGALLLGRLMEEGKGGPQDLSGAMTLYLESTEYCGDDAWKAMNRLRKQGQPLNELQTKRFQQIWVKGLVNRHRRLLAVREVAEAVNATGEPKKVTLSYLFKSGSGTPQVTMITGSGDANVDRWIMKAISRLTMGDFAPLTDSSGELEIRAPIELPLLDAQKLVGMCGSRPCS